MSIQTLCRSANPLGKIMDYVQVCIVGLLNNFVSLNTPYHLPSLPPSFLSQEDIDSMQKELEMWQLENRKHAEALQKEQRYVQQLVCTIPVTRFPSCSITERELQPLRAQLEGLEAKIVEQVHTYVLCSHQWLVGGALKILR